MCVELEIGFPHLDGFFLFGGLEKDNEESCCEGRLYHLSEE